MHGFLMIPLSTVTIYIQGMISYRDVTNNYKYQTQLAVDRAISMLYLIICYTTMKTDGNFSEHVDRKKSRPAGKDKSNSF